MGNLNNSSFLSSEIPINQTNQNIQKLEVSQETYFNERDKKPYPAESNADSEFERDSRRIFHNNTQYYTDNDKNFIHGMHRMFGDAMHAKGLNIIDPIGANFFHYNKTSMRGNADYPRVTRTYVFFTRPELNFSFENIQSIPFFKWLASKPIGRMAMAALTDPEYYINAPSVFNSMSTSTLDQLSKALNEYTKAIKENSDIINAQDSTFASTGSGEVGGGASFGTPSSDDEVKAYTEAMKQHSLSDLDDENELKKLETKAGNLSNLYKKVEEADLKYQNSVKSFEKSIAAGAKTSLGLLKAKNVMKHLFDKTYKDYNYTTPFIPILGNTCTQLTGAKALNLEMFNYEEDLFSSNLNVPTGMDSVFSGGTLSSTFEDIAYNPASLLILTWLLYIHYVSRGYIVTTREHIIERILDYTCSIYVFVIGDNGRRIERWGKFTGAYPTSFPLDAQLEHNLNIDIDVLQKVNVSWSYNRFEFMNPEIFTDFNFLSETEWLAKLKEPLWENLYDRRTDLAFIDKSFYDITRGKSESESLAEKSFLKALNRPDNLWKCIKKEERGASGMIPEYLITGSTHKTYNNYWGGYPYINKGTDFIWVLPQWSIADVVRDQKDIKNYKEDGSQKFEKRTDDYIKDDKGKEMKNPYKNPVSKHTQDQTKTIDMIKL